MGVALTSSRVVTALSFLKEVHGEFGNSLHFLFGAGVSNMGHGVGDVVLGGEVLPGAVLLTTCFDVEFFDAV